MLTNEDIETLRDRYIELIKGTKRGKAFPEDVDALIAYLDEVGFFNAPASTEYHCAFPGGLCLHSLDVYDALKALTDTLALVSVPEGDTEEEGSDGWVDKPIYDDDSLVMVALLHDIGKVDRYTLSSVNEKVYCDDGSKSDSFGRFEWRSRMGYKVADAEQRKNLGFGGMSSYLIASRFLPLSEEESMAIIYQYGANGIQIPDLHKILERYNLCVYLHSADEIATYHIEKNG